MTRDELIQVLQNTGKGDDTVVTEGCGGHCVQDIDLVELDEGCIELKADLL